MNIAGLTPTEQTALPYLLGHTPAPENKALNWDKMQVGMVVSFMFAELVQRSNGYQGQSFVSANILYLPNTVQTIEDVATQGLPYSMPLTTVLKKAIVEDRTIKVGQCYQLTYLGRVNTKGAVVNYDNFKIAAYNSPELDATAKSKWEETQGVLDTSTMYSLATDPAAGGDLVVVNGQAPVAPVAPAPVAPVAPAPVAPVAPAPVAPAPVAPAPVAPAPVAPVAPVAPAPVAAAPVAAAPVAPAPVAPAPVAAAPIAPAPIAPAPVAPAPVAPVAPSPVAGVVPAFPTV